MPHLTPSLSLSPSQAVAMTRCLSWRLYVDGLVMHTHLCVSLMFLSVCTDEYMCVDTFQTLQLPETNSSFKLVIWITQIVVLTTR